MAANEDRQQYVFSLELREDAGLGRALRHRNIDASNDAAVPLPTSVVEDVADVRLTGTSGDTIDDHINASTAR